MNTAFLYLAILWLAPRFPCLFRRRPLGTRGWILKAGIELGGLAVLSGGPAWLGAAATVVVLNLLGWRCDRRTRGREAGQVALGALALVLASVWCSPALGLDFRPGVRALASDVASWTALGALMAGPGFASRAALVLLGGLLATGEANLVIRALLDRFGLRPDPPKGGGSLDLQRQDNGRLIGVLERTAVYAFVLLGEFGAIGLVLAAKGLVRFKEMENRAFAEYVLIGTLLSVLAAVAAGGLVRAVLLRG